MDAKRKHRLKKFPFLSEGRPKGSSSSHTQIPQRAFHQKVDTQPDPLLWVSGFFHGILSADVESAMGLRTTKQRGRGTKRAPGRQEGMYTLAAFLHFSELSF